MEQQLASNDAAPVLCDLLSLVWTVTVTFLNSLPAICLNSLPLTCLNSLLWWLPGSRHTLWLSTVRHLRSIVSTVLCPCRWDVSQAAWQPCTILPSAQSSPCSNTALCWFFSFTPHQIEIKCCQQCLSSKYHKPSNMMVMVTFFDPQHQKYYRPNASQKWNKLEEKEHYCFVSLCCTRSIKQLETSQPVKKGIKNS